MNMSKKEFDEKVTVLAAARAEKILLKMSRDLQENTYSLDEAILSLSSYYRTFLICLANTIENLSRNTGGGDLARLVAITQQDLIDLVSDASSAASEGKQTHKIEKNFKK